MGLIYWIEYKCPLCGRKLDDREIAQIHFTKECPHCNMSVHINGHKILTRTSTASCLAFISAVIYFSIIAELYTSLVRKGELPNIPELLNYILFYMYIGLGIALAVVIPRIYKNLMLWRAMNKMKDNQPNDDSNNKTGNR